MVVDFTFINIKTKEEYNECICNLYREDIDNIKMIFEDIIKHMKWDKSHTIISIPDDGSNFYFQYENGIILEKTGCYECIYLNEELNKIKNELINLKNEIKKLNDIRN